MVSKQYFKKQKNSENKKALAMKKAPDKRPGLLTNS